MRSLIFSSGLLAIAAVITFCYLRSESRAADAGLTAFAATVPAPAAAVLALVVVAATVTVVLADGSLHRWRARTPSAGVLS